MIHLGELTPTFGAGGRAAKRRRPQHEPLPAGPYRPALLVLEGETLRESAGQLVELVELWQSWRAREADTEEAMRAVELDDLAETIETRAARAIVRSRDDVPEGRRQRDLCRKLVSDELRSEWLRRHGRRPGQRPARRAETRALALIFDQLDAAVQHAIAEPTEPAAMPALAASVIRSFTTAAARR